MIIMLKGKHIKRCNYTKVQLVYSSLHIIILITSPAKLVNSFPCSPSSAPRLDHVIYRSVASLEQDLYLLPEA